MGVTIADAFWANVDRRASDECWPWTGVRADARGYGRLNWGGAHQQATHVSLELDGRPVPDGLIACHTCDNPPCVNPAHLYAGTYADNVRDMLNRGRVNRSPEYADRKAKATRRVWASLSEDERSERRRRISTARTPDVRCAVPLVLSGEPCFRVPGHGGPHRSRASMEQRRRARV